MWILRNQPLWKIPFSMLQWAVLLAGLAAAADVMTMCTPRHETFVPFKACEGVRVLTYFLQMKELPRK